MESGQTEPEPRIGIGRLGRPPTVRRYAGTWIGPAAAVLAVIMAGSSCSSDTSGPDPVTVSFDSQPTTVESGVAIAPPVEIAIGSGGRQTVTMSIADNDCGAVLAGTLSRPTVGGVATFSDLRIDIPTDGFRLEARVLDQSLVSAPFDVIVSDPGGSFEQHSTVCMRRQPSWDSGSLAWVAADDVLWTADDIGNLICGLDRRTGSCVNEVTRAEFIEAFPDADACDDEDGDPTTTCSYTNEFEVVAFDDSRGLLYVFNTVNDPTSDPVVDRPAVFRLRPGGCRGCVTFDSWQELPASYSYRAAVSIEGALYIANGRDLHRYDYDTNVVTEDPAFSASLSTITGLSFSDGVLNLLTRSRKLLVVDWDEREVEDSHDLTPIGVASASGVEVVRDSIYVLEGDPRDPIYVITITPESP